jgi:hypothetical protein
MLLGESDQNEFAGVVDFIRLRTGREFLRTATDADGIRQLVEEGWHPDLIVVLQSWPDQFSGAEVHELMGRYPLARIICCFGPWCDSDGRTNSIWPLAVRVPVAAAAGRLAREFAILENGGAALLPLTASRAEIFEFDFGPLFSRGNQSPAAVVISPDQPWREMIESALRRVGFGIHDPHGAECPDVVVFDADPWDAGRSTALRAVRAVHRQANIVAAVGFPRQPLAAELLDAGADRVWFKLASLSGLVDAAEIEPGYRRQ